MDARKYRPLLGAIVAGLRLKRQAGRLSFYPIPIARVRVSIQGLASSQLFATLNAKQAKSRATGSQNKARMQRAINNIKIYLMRRIPGRMLRLALAGDCVSYARSSWSVRVTTPRPSGAQAESGLRLRVRQSSGHCGAG